MIESQRIEFEFFNLILESQTFDWKVKFELQKIKVWFKLKK